VARVKSCSPTADTTCGYASANRRSKWTTYPAVCSKRVTLLGKYGSRKIESRRARGTEQALRMLGDQLFGPGGDYHSRILDRWAANSGRGKGPSRKRPCRSRAPSIDNWFFAGSIEDHATLIWLGISFSGRASSRTSQRNSLAKRPTRRNCAQSRALIAQAERLSSWCVNRCSEYNSGQGPLLLCLRRPRTFTRNPQSIWLILGQSCGPVPSPQRRIVPQREAYAKHWRVRTAISQQRLPANTYSNVYGPPL
jgi:hypothetical protein